MHRCRWIAGLALPLLLVPQAQAASRGVKPADLIRAAKAAAVGEIDDRKKTCHDDRTVEQWLAEAVRSIKWSGGRCKLANKNSPRDAGTKWCARADIAPRKGGPPATIEVYFDEPKDGQPGKAFAFRASVRTQAGWDYMRETAAFEQNWGEAYISGFKPPESDPCE